MRSVLLELADSRVHPADLTQLVYYKKLIRLRKRQFNILDKNNCEINIKRDKLSTCDYNNLCMDKKTNLSKNPDSDLKRRPRSRDSTCTRHGAVTSTRHWLTGTLLVTTLCVLHHQELITREGFTRLWLRWQELPLDAHMVRTTHASKHQVN